MVGRSGVFRVAIMEQVPGPLSSMRRCQDATVSGVMLKRRAVLARVQPCAARSWRMRKRSGARNSGRLCGDMRLMRAVLIPMTSLSKAISVLARSSLLANRTRAIGLFAHQARVNVTARNARSTTPSKPDLTFSGQSAGNGMVQDLSTSPRKARDVADGGVRQPKRRGLVRCSITPLQTTSDCRRGRWRLYSS